MSSNNDSQIQMGQLTSHITVVDEDQLLTPEQLDKIAQQVMLRLEQKMALQHQRMSDQAISSNSYKNEDW